MSTEETKYIVNLGNVKLIPYDPVAAAKWWAEAYELWLARAPEEEDE